jgi:hypothetical protein
VSTELTRSELLPVCVAGDVVLETGYLARVVEAFDPARQAASVAVRQVAGSTGFDAVDIEDGTGVGVRTGPDDPTVPTAGAVASTPALLDHASTLHPPREALVDALDSLVAAGGPVHAEAGFWTAVASAEDVLDANRVLLDRRVDPRLRGLCESPGIPPGSGFRFVVGFALQRGPLRSRCLSCPSAGDGPQRSQPVGLPWSVSRRRLSV